MTGLKRKIFFCDFLKILFLNSISQAPKYTFRKSVNSRNAPVAFAISFNKVAETKITDFHIKGNLDIEKPCRELWQ